MDVCQGALIKWVMAVQACLSMSPLYYGRKGEQWQWGRNLTLYSTDSQPQTHKRKEG
jgi:hypothetical protein